MKRKLSLVLTVLMLLGFIFSGGPGMTVWANGASDASVPGIPTSFAAEKMDTSRIRLSWGVGDGITHGFRIERKLSAGSWEHIKNINDKDTLSYIDIDLNPDTMYYYQIRAFNDIGDSSYTDPVHAATDPVVLKPVAPTSLAASGITATQVTLTWNDNSNNEDGFRIERKTGTGDYTEIATVNANVTSYTNSSLSNSTTYIYQVRAYNTDGHSDPTNPVTVTTPAAIPGKPTSLRATEVARNKVVLTWNDSSSNATSFKIERREGTSGNFVLLNPTTTITATSYSDSNVTENKTYSYRVMASNGSGDSVYSDIFIVTPASVPAKPDNLKISSTGTDRLAITWTDNSNNEKGFRIERKTGNGGYSEIATVDTNVTSYSNNNLDRNTTYTYRVRAYNDAGNSPYSNEISGKTGVVLAKPDTLEVSSINTDRVTITWKDRTNNEKGFIIERKMENGSYSEIANVRANTTSYTDTRLRNNTAYTYRIQAYNDEGRSEFSEELKVTTGLVPDKPTNLAVTLVGTDRIRIEWKDNADNETGFRIERKTENGSFTEVTTVRTNTEAYTNTGLRNRTEYTYRVRAYNDTGNSAFSNEVSSITGLVPEAPDRLTVTSEETDRVSLSWRDQSDNENGFILERKTGTGSFIKMATLSANTTVYTDRNLTTGQNYTYRVKAYNDSGESSNSNEVVAKTSKEIVTTLSIGSTQYRVDGQLMQMDAAPVIYESRTLLPIRYIAEAIGATIQWDATTQKVTVMLDETVVELWIGNNIAKVNGVSTQIDANNSQVKPLIFPPGRTMIPLSFVTRSLGCDVQWNDATREVTVTYPAR